jgi:hypothetical protein
MAQAVELNLGNGKTLKMDGTNIQTATGDINLDAPPILRFLAWQDDWQTNQSGAARHQDGSPVTDTTELNWLQEILPAGCVKARPEQQFLTIWVSHPAFTMDSFTELLDGDGRRIQPGNEFYGNYAADGKGEGEKYGNLPFHCWKCWCFCPNDITNRPARLSFKLRYAIGPLEQTNILSAPYFNDPAWGAIQYGCWLEKVGQDVRGQAFVSITVNTNTMASRVFGVVAVGKDGQEQRPAFIKYDSHQEFTFNRPLSEVSRFIIGSRPIRTVEWNNVILPGNPVPR